MEKDWNFKNSSFMLSFSNLTLNTSQSNQIESANKFSEAQFFIQQIIKGVIKCVSFDYSSYYFHTYGTSLYFYGLTVHCFCLFYTCRL